MKIKILLLLLLTIAGSFLEFIFAQNLSDKGITIEQGKGFYIINFQLPNYQIINKNIEKKKGEFEKFSFIEIPEYGITYSEGEPQLPQITFNVAIPYNQEKIPHFEIIEQTTKKIPIKGRIFPAQWTYPSLTGTTKNEFKINQKAYSENQQTKEIIAISEPFIMSGVKGVSVSIFPFCYDPILNMLEVATSVKFKLEREESILTKMAKTKTLEDYLNRQFVNYVDCENMFLQSELKSANVENTKGKFLMLVPWKYDNLAFKYFLNKKAQGYDVTYYRYLGYEYGMSLTSPSDIKSVIQSAYNNINTRPEYVLLIGDYNEVGTWVYDIENILIPSDFGYTQLDGTDIYADVSFGRWPVSSYTELENTINKSIEMDNKFVTHENSPKKATIISDYDPDFWYDLFYPNYEQTSDVIATCLENEGYTCEKIYKRLGGTTNDIINAFNNESYIVTYRGHGGINFWNEPRFSVSNNHHLLLTNLTYPIIFSIACHTANFTASNNLGAKMVNSLHGGVAFLGGTELTPTETNAFFGRRMFGNSYHNLNNIVKIIDDAKAYIARTIFIPPTTNERKKRLIVAYNFLGDPSLQVRYDGANDYVITGGKTTLDETIVFPVAENIDVAGIGAQYGFPVALDYTIRGDGTNGANVTIQATNSITLKPGFKVERGATFSASIISGTLSNLIPKNKNYTTNSNAVNYILDKDKDKDKDNQSPIRCYPNPFSEQISFQITLASKEKISISIFDIKGSFIKQLLAPNEYQKGTHTLSYDLSSLKTELYIYKINVGDKMFYSKILKN